MADYICTDGPRVHPDAALELMVHHLQLAHMYFQVAPDDHDANKIEAFRLFTAGLPTMTKWVDDGGIGSSQEIKLGLDGPEIVAGMAWLERMEEIYQAMKQDD